MDLTHWIVVAAVFFAVGFAVGIGVFGFWKLRGAAERDEAIDAAIFLAQREAQRELREWFARSRSQPGAP